MSLNPDLSFIAREVRRRRRARRLTQHELAIRVRIGQSTVARIEAGRHLPRLSTLARLEAELGKFPDPARCGCQDHAGGRHAD